MRRRLLRIVFPVALIASIIAVVASLVFWRTEEHYRTASNQEAAALLGVATTTNDAAEMIANLRHPSAAQISTGTELLYHYGYLPSDYASLSAGRFFQQTLLLMLAAIIIFAVAVIIYFGWRDRRRSQQVTRLITYIQHLNERVYDLRLEQNSEDELSQLSNELYKFMVVLREAAENNQKARQQLETALADISHQLRTPLTSMQVLVDNIHDDPNMPVAVRQDFLRSISRQVESMSDLVTTLLNLAKFDNGTIHLQRSFVETGELLQKVCRKLEVLADLCEVTITLEGDLHAKVRLDQRWQVEALTNIVKNCLEHSDPGSQVTLRAQDGPLFWRLHIIDTGEGIAAKDLRRIFDRFYKTANSVADSVGIGLAFAKTVIEADRGQITAKSQVGRGTEFIVTYFK